MSLEIQKSYHLPFLAVTLEWRLLGSYVKKAGFSLKHFRHSQIVHITKATAERQVLVWGLCEAGNLIVWANPFKGFALQSDLQ